MSGETIEVHEGHEVTQAAVDVNIGSGLLEAMKIDPHAYRGGDIIDIVTRVQIAKVIYEPVNKEDFDGPWKRVHKCKPLAAVPTDHTTVASILDAHLSKVSKRRELPGQTSIDDDFDQQVALAEASGATDEVTKKRRTRKPKA